MKKNKLKGLDRCDTFEQTLKNYTNYIKKIASTLCADDETFKELVQVGSIRLNYCWENFDSTKNDSFKGYCGLSIKGEMMRFLSRDSRSVKIPEYLVNDKEFIKPSMVLTSTIIGEDLTIGDMLVDEVEDEGEDDIQLNQMNLLKKYVSRLKPTFVEILKLRFEEELTFEEIATKLNLNSKQTAQSRFYNAIGTLQRMYGMNTDNRKITSKQR